MLVGPYVSRARITLLKCHCRVMFFDASAFTKLLCSLSLGAHRFFCPSDTALKLQRFYCFCFLVLFCNASFCFSFKTAAVWTVPFSIEIRSHQEFIVLGLCSTLHVSPTRFDDFVFRLLARAWFWILFVSRCGGLGERMLTKPQCA